MYKSSCNQRCVTGAKFTHIFTLICQVYQTSGHTHNQASSGCASTRTFLTSRWLWYTRNPLTPPPSTGTHPYNTCQTEPFPIHNPPSGHQAWATLLCSNPSQNQVHTTCSLLPFPTHLSSDSHQKSLMKSRSGGPSPSTRDCRVPAARKMCMPHPRQPWLPSQMF